MDSEPSPYKTIATSIRRYTRKNGFAIRAYGPGHSKALESHILFEVEMKRSVEAREVASLLRLPLSSVTRVLNHLVQSKILESNIPEHDKRRKYYALTSEGVRYLLGLHERLNAGIEIYLDHLDASQRSDFYTYMEMFFATDNVRHQFSRHASSIMQDVYRITREYNLLNRNRFQRYNISTLAWHVLCEIQEESRPLSASDISKRYGVAANTLSSALKQLYRVQLIERTPMKHDGRRYQLHLSDHGRILLSRIMREQCQELRCGLATLSEEECSHFAELLELFVDGTSARTNNTNPRFSTLDDSEERITARQFLLHKLLERDDPSSLPPYLLHQDSYCFALHEHQELLAVAEVTWQDAVWRLYSFEYQSALSSTLLNYFITQIHKTLDRARKNSDFTIATSAQASFSNALRTVRSGLSEVFE